MGVGDIKLKKKVLSRNLWENSATAKMVVPLLTLNTDHTSTNHTAPLTCVGEVHAVSEAKTG